MQHKNLTLLFLWPCQNYFIFLLSLWIFLGGRVTSVRSSRVSCIQCLGPESSHMQDRGLNSGPQISQECFSVPWARSLSFLWGSLYFCRTVEFNIYRFRERKDDMPRDAQKLFLALFSGVTSDGAQGTYALLGIDPGVPANKASILLFVLSLYPTLIIKWMTLFFLK